MALGDTREPPSQLDGSRELAALLVDGADRRGIRLSDDEHRWSMGTGDMAGNRSVMIMPRLPGRHGWT